MVAEWLQISQLSTLCLEHINYLSYGTFVHNESEGPGRFIGSEGSPPREKDSPEKILYKKNERINSVQMRFLEEKSREKCRGKEKQLYLKGRKNNQCMPTENSHVTHLNEYGIKKVKKRLLKENKIEYKKLLLFYYYITP